MPDFADRRAYWSPRYNCGSQRPIGMRAYIGGWIAFMRIQPKGHTQNPVEIFAKLDQDYQAWIRQQRETKGEDKAQDKVPFVRRPVLKHGVFCPNQLRM